VPRHRRKILEISPVEGHRPAPQADLASPGTRKDSNYTMVEVSS
jgi:hypothetical protein